MEKFNIENCENGELPAEEQDLIDMKGVEELLGQNRSSAIIWKMKEAKAFADKNNLDLIELDGPIPELKTPNRYIVAKKEKLANLLEGKVNAYSGPFSDKMREFYAKIKDLSASEATKVLINEPFNEKGIEVPEVAILEGLMFGYKPCDIEYYINTRYLGQKEHSLEDVGDEVGHVVCENCAKEIKELEEKENQGKKILEILNYAIESKSKIELTVSNPPTNTFNTAIVTPEKIENGYLHVITRHNTKIVIELSRVKRVIVWPWE